MGLKSSLLSFYEKRYKSLLVLTLILLLAAVGVLLINYANTGEFVSKGVSLKGGLTLTIPAREQVNIDQLEDQLASALPQGDVSVRRLTEAGRLHSIIVEASDVTDEEVLDALATSGISLERGEYTVQYIGSSLGASFFRQTIIAVIFAFLAMGVVVFITFRKLVPSLFVILAASSDILCTLAVMVLLDVKLTVAGVAAFLMIIGYSVDTDILLTTRVLKRKEGGTVFQRTLGAMRTGLIMSGTSFAAVLIVYIFTQSDIIKQIMFILAVALVFDVINTWIQNAGILRWYLERKEHHG